MRLYYAPGACSLAPHIIAREAALSVDLAKVDLATKRTDEGEDFQLVNSRGSVPALMLDDGFLLTEAAVITQYLADQNPAADLIPTGGRDRYIVQQWLNFIATELHKGFGPLWDTKTPAEMRDVTKLQLANKFAFLDRHLARRDYLHGNQFGVADAYAFTILGWAKHMAIDLARWASLSAFVERVGRREKVREALISEGLVEAAAAA